MENCTESCPPASRNTVAELVFGLAPIHSIHAKAEPEKLTGGIITTEPPCSPLVGRVFLLPEATPFHMCKDKCVAFTDKSGKKKPYREGTSIACILYA